VHGERLTTVHSIARVSERATLVRLDLGGRAFPYRAGQAVGVGLATQGERTPYSIAGSPADARAEGRIEILVGHGRGRSPGPHLTPLRVGSIVAVRGPFGGFSLPSRLGPSSRLALIAGGTGIAPLRAMLGDALARIRPPAIDVVYSVRTPRELAFDQEFRRLHAAGVIRYTKTVTRDAAWRGRRGRIDAGLLRGVIEGPTTCLVCGPASFVTDLSAHLRALGVDPRRIKREEY
jgi:ferredoxin-NADP reductase